MTAELKDDAPIPPEINKYLAILSKDPGSMVFAPLAEAYRKAGMLDEAIATAQDGLKSHPNYLSGMVALGRAYYEKGMFKEAGESLEQVIRMAPDNIIAANILEEIKKQWSVVRGQGPEKPEPVTSNLEPDTAVSQKSEVSNQKIEEPETAEILEVEEVAELTEAEAEEETEGFQINEISIEAPEPGWGFTKGTEEPIPVPIEVPNETITEPHESKPAIEVRSAAPPISSKEAEEARPRKEITTETIAELYIKQGYLDKAVDIYQTLYNADPGNEEIKRKLDELRMQGSEVEIREEEIGVGWAEPTSQATDVVVQLAVPVKEAGAVGRDNVVVSPELKTQNSKLKTDENINRLESWLEAIQSERRKG